MSRDDEDLRINTLHALRKRSPQVVLEEHDHCEVPAGCGGVVLRWRDPMDGTPAVLSVVSEGSTRAWLDGVEIQTAYLSLRPGQRQLTIELRGLPAVPAPVVVVIGPQDRELPALYASAPGPDWQARPLDLPEQAFAPMQEAEDLLAAAMAGPRRWRFQQAIERGGRALRAEAPALLLRFSFLHREDP